MINVAPPLQYPRIVEEQGKGATFASAAALTALAAAAAGAAAMLTRNLGLSHAAEEAQRAKDASKAKEKEGV
jgi:hydrogenase small subunit